jgi:eukaryotic-like serine/threonine-protein kinase
MNAVPWTQAVDGFPSHLGRYTILGRVASGGMATVYVGRQSGAAGFERIVAIKACHDHARHNQEFASRFLEEARLAARIRHPNVVATLDVSDGDPLYLIMEYVEGGSLSALARCAMTRGNRLPLEVSLRIVMDALAGLQATHEAQGPDGRPLCLVHCDISPQNILVGVDGAARITDFGIARAAARLRDDRGSIEGKLSYMAPEQLSSGPITQRTDLFSMGVVLWELLTGRSLFRERSDEATIRATLGRSIPPPSTIDPTLPRALDAVVLRAVQRNPARRFGSALEFLTALEQLPVAPATARTVGECVRQDRSSLVPDWQSGSYRKAARLDEVEDDPSVLRTAVSEAPRSGASTTDELPTRVLAPAPDLLVAAREPIVPWPPRPPVVSRPDPSAPDGLATRRLVAAIALVLLGGAVGLLMASSPSPSPPPGASPSVHAPR